MDANFRPVFENLTEAARILRPRVAAIGNFDGVHLGHQALLGFARRLGRPVLAITFSPHPAEFFGSFDYRPLLPMEQKLSRLLDSGSDGVANLPFSRDFSQLPAEAFVQILVEKLGIDHVAVGSDFHFGADRQGDTGLLGQILHRQDVRLHVLPLATWQDHPIHSRTIRRALSDGDLKTASAMLGHDYTLYGTVVHGMGIGRILGFPTANLITRQWIPAEGVYSATVAVDEGRFPAAFSIGRRETIGRDLPMALEACLLDTCIDLYDRPIAVTLHRLLRPQIHFPSREALVARMKKDIAIIRKESGQSDGH